MFFFLRLLRSGFTFFAVPLGFGSLVVAASSLLDEAGTGEGTSAGARCSCAGAGSGCGCSSWASTAPGHMMDNVVAKLMTIACRIAAVNTLVPRPSHLLWNIEDQRGIRKPPMRRSAMPCTCNALGKSARLYSQSLSLFDVTATAPLAAWSALSCTSSTGRLRKGRLARCPLYPKKRTSTSVIAMSAKC